MGAPTRRLSPILAAVMAISACASENEADRGFTVRDSAGITIVENRATPGSLPVWSLGSSILDIGVAEGSSEYQLFRVVDALVLEGGSVALINAGSGEVRFYSEEGQFLRSFGRPGEGPGEFDRPSLIRFTKADSIVIYDEGLGRFSVLSQGGMLARTFELDRVLANLPRASGIIADSLVVTHEMVYSIPDSGFDTMRIRVRFSDLHGRTRDSLEVPSRRIGWIRGGGTLVAGGPHFEPLTYFAA